MNLVDLGERGVDFVKQRLGRLGGAESGLNAFSSALEVVDAQTLIASQVSFELMDFSRARTDDVLSSVDATRAFVRQWLTDCVRGIRRYEVFQDRFSVRGRGVEQPDAFYFENQVYFVQPDPRAPGASPEVFLNIGYFEDVGFLVEVSNDWRPGVEFTDDDLKTLKRGIVAALVWAWDNDGIIIASIGEPLTRQAGPATNAAA